MKKLYGFIATLLVFAACGNTAGEEVAAQYPGITVTDLNLMQGYFLNGETVVFIFDAETWGMDSPDEVEVRGTFNSWDHSDDWVLTEISKGLWMMEKSIDDTAVPANSGQPEFKYVVDGAWLQPPAGLSAGYVCSDGYSGYNGVVLFEGDDPATVAEKYILATTVITNYASDAEMANFREVATGDIANGILYRSYNPFMTSKDTHPLEEERLLAVQALMEENGIQSVINLSEEADEMESKDLPAYYQGIVDRGDIVYANTGYSTVYFKSDGEEFAETVREIALFITEHEPPYLIHCRLGTDRTGVTTAVLEAFMGATWAEIREDYLKSNNLGIEEYRDEKLLEYSLENMLNIDISDETVMRDEMAEYLKTSAGLTDEEIIALSSRLSGE